MSVKLFISYALNHVTTEMVKNVFDTIFDNEVTQIMELSKLDRDTGKPFKLFWITLDPARHSRVWRFVEQIKIHGRERIIYETKKGKDYYWQVRINKDPEPTKFTPRIMPREQPQQDDELRADVVAFSKTPQFAKIVESVKFEIVEPQIEPGEIVEFREAKRKGASAIKDGKKPRA